MWNFGDSCQPSWRFPVNPKAKMVVNSKTIKPGSNMQQKTNAKAAADKANSNLKKSGKVDDAAMALLARMGAKKR